MVRRARDRRPPHSLPGSPAQTLGGDQHACVFYSAGANLRQAIENGVTPDKIRGMVVQIASYAGSSTGLGLGKTALPFLESGAE